MRIFHKISVLRIILVIMFACLSVGQAYADKTGDLRREQLAKVKRLAVLPLFFGSETLREPKSNAPKLITKQDKPEKNEKPETPQSLEAFRVHLRKMEARANERLPERLSERTPFKVIPETEQTEALKSSELLPYTLFQDGKQFEDKGNIGGFCWRIGDHVSNFGTAGYIIEISHPFVEKLGLIGENIAGKVLRVSRERHERNGERVQSTGNVQNGRNGRTDFREQSAIKILHKRQAFCRRRMMPHPLTSKGETFHFAGVCRCLRPMDIFWLAFEICPRNLMERILRRLDRFLERMTAGNLPFCHAPDFVLSYT